MVAPQRFKSGNRCRNCIAISQRKTKEEFVDEIKSLTSGEYELIGEYKAARFLTEFKHLKCGNIFPSTPNNFLAGNRCPHCYLSKGEQKIANYLDKKSITYKQEVTFSDLKMESLLRYDFGIYSKSKELIALIEYDGQHHFKPIEIWGGDKEFEKTLERDKIKDNYAIENNIYLLRIPYWEFDNVEEILEEKLKGDNNIWHLNG